MDEPEEITGLRPLAEIKRAPILVEDNELLLDSGHFEQLQRVAHVMAACEALPEFLHGHVAHCFLVADQAFRWKMSPFAVAQKTFFVKGKLAYEGQLIAAVVNTRAGLEEPLDYRFFGSEADPKTLGVAVVGRFIGTERERSVEVTWESGYAAAKGARDQWIRIPAQMLSYYGARAWARRHAPQVILGAYTPEEIAEDLASRSDRATDVTPEPDAPKGKLAQLEEMMRRAKEAARVTQRDEPISSGEAVLDSQIVASLAESGAGVDFWKRESYEIEVPMLSGGKYRDWRAFSEVLTDLINCAPTAEALTKLTEENRDTLKAFKVSSPALAAEARKVYDIREAELQ